LDSYKLIKTNILPAVQEVRFYPETENHIREHHPEVPIELPSIQQAVELAIQRPTHVEVSYGNSYVFVDSGSTNKSGDPLRVPIKMIDSTVSGRVKSAYFASSEGDRQVIWSQRDD
jgi:hypothetical protein